MALRSSRDGEIDDLASSLGSVEGLSFSGGTGIPIDV